MGAYRRPKGTGEEWAGARLTLSTATLRQDTTPPEIAPLRIDMAGRAPRTRVVMSRAGYQPRLQGPTGAASAETSTRLRVEAQGLSVQLQAPVPADVPGAGTPVLLWLARTALRGPVKLRSAPKLAPFVFRVAERTNLAPFPLLPGPIDVLRRGQFLGRHQFERVGSGAPFPLTLGIEEGVKVKRTLPMEAARDRGVLGPTKRRRYGYRFEVRRYLPRPDTVEIAAHVPISEQEDIRVGRDDRRLRAAPGGRYRHLGLRPGGQRALELRRYVDVPWSYDPGDEKRPMAMRPAPVPSVQGAHWTRLA